MCDIPMDNNRGEIWLPHIVVISFNIVLLSFNIVVLSFNIVLLSFNIVLLSFNTFGKGLLD